MKEYNAVKALYDEVVQRYRAKIEATPLKVDPYTFEYQSTWLQRMLRNIKVENDVSPISHDIFEEMVDHALIDLVKLEDICNTV